MYFVHEPSNPLITFNVYVSRGLFWVNKGGGALGYAPKEEVNDLAEANMKRIGSGPILEHLVTLGGQPVRVTLLDASSRERTARLHGVLTSIRGTGLTIECVDSVPALVEGTPMAVEAMVKGVQTWFHTSLTSTVRRAASQILLRLPEKVQTIQRRQHPRVDFDAPVHLVLKGIGQVIKGTLRDLSAGGASIRLSGPVVSGEIVQLIFNLGSGLFFENLEGEVLRCAPVPDGSMIVGLQFRCSDEQRDLLAQWVNQRLSS